MTLNVILLTLGILALFEALIILAFPKAIMNAGRALFRSVNKLRNVALLELVIGILLVLAGVLLFIK